MDLDWRDDACSLVVAGGFLKDRRSTVTDKDAMEKAARVHNEALRYFGNAGFDAVFKNGWKAAHKGPKVLALVEALKFYQDERNWIKSDGLVCSWAIADTGMRAKKALAEFEGEK